MPNKSNLTFRKGCSRAKRNVEPKLGVLLLIPSKVRSLCNELQINLRHADILNVTTIPRIKYRIEVAGGLANVEKLTFNDNLVVFEDESFKKRCLDFMAYGMTPDSAKELGLIASDLYERGPFVVQSHSDQVGNCTTFERI